MFQKKSEKKSDKIQKDLEISFLKLNEVIVKYDSARREVEIINKINDFQYEMKQNYRKNNYVFES